MKASAFITGLEDRTLLLQLGEGNREAFDTLYSRYWKQVFNQAYKRVGDETYAQDIAQDVFFQLWTRGSQSNIENLPAYLFVSVRNGVFRHFEKESKYASLSDIAFEIETLHDRPDSNVLYAEFLKSFGELVDSLPAKQRVIFRMRYEEGLSTQQIADGLQLSVKTVRNHLGRALATLRESLLVVQILLVIFRR